MTIFEEDTIIVTDQLVIPDGSIFKNNVTFKRTEDDMSSDTSNSSNFILVINSVTFEKGANFQQLVCQTNLNFTVQEDNLISFSNCSISLEKSLEKLVNINYKIEIKDSEFLNENISITFSNKLDKLDNKLIATFIDTKISCNFLKLEKNFTLNLQNNGSYPMFKSIQIIIDGNSILNNYGYRISTNKLSLLNGKIINNYLSFSDVDDSTKMVGLFSHLIFPILEYKKGEIVNEEGCFVITPSKHCKLKKIIRNKGYFLNFHNEGIKIEKAKSENFVDTIENYDYEKYSWKHHIYLFIILGFLLFLLLIFIIFFILRQGRS
jgi:hypothetical protein